MRDLRLVKQKSESGTAKGAEFETRLMAVPFFPVCPAMQK